MRYRQSAIDTERSQDEKNVASDRYRQIPTDHEGVHNVYLYQQALDIMIALLTCAGGSRVLLPSRYDASRCISKATLNCVTQAVVEKAKESGLPLEPFTEHDLRRTGFTILNELGFNSDWIEKALAHEDGRSSRGVYNMAEYSEHLRHILQEWADMIDAWVAGKRCLRPASVFGRPSCRPPESASQRPGKAPSNLLA